MATPVLGVTVVSVVGVGVGKGRFSCGGLAGPGDGGDGGWW